MVFHFGAAGTAQQLKTANAGNPPTAVSIAENASTGQDNSFTISDGDPDIFTVEYSDWSSATSESFGTQYAKDISNQDLGDFEEDGRVMMTVHAYLRATGATSFGAWTGQVYAHSFGSGSADPSGAVTGAGGSGQDGTGGSGVGLRFYLYPGSGRGGALIWPSNGDYIIYKLTGTATNSDGSTTADLYLRYDFTN